jgi:hypothetical protein
MKFQTSTIVLSVLALGGSNASVLRRQNNNGTAVANGQNQNVNGQNININDPAQLAAILASQNGQNVNLNDPAQLVALLSSQQQNNINANSILALLSNNNNNINSLNGLDVNTLNTLLSSGVNANQIAALVGSGFNSQQISALLLNNGNGNISNLVGGQDIQLQQLLSDLGNGNIATGATNMANLLLQATSNNPTIANDLNNLLAAQGLVANGQNVNGGASVTVISSSSAGTQVINGQGIAVAA